MYTYNKETLDAWKKALRKEPVSIEDAMKDADSKLDETMKNLSGSLTSKEEAKNLQMVADLTEYKNWLEDIKTTINEELPLEFSCFNNGHSEYMIVGLLSEKDAFLTWAAIVAQEDCLAGVQIRPGKDNFTYTGYFTTCERYPEYVEELSKLFTTSKIYGVGSWDIVGLETNGLKLNQDYTVSLDECFEDYGNIRIDVGVTDTDSGEGICLGDLFCFDTLEDLDNRNDNADYCELVGMISDAADLARIDSVLEECRKYHLS